jgi:serine/threonine-protein kinase RsbW
MTGSNGTGPPHGRQYEIHTPAELLSVLGQVVTAMREHGYSEMEEFGVRLALEEAIINAIKHGHRGDPAKVVRFRYEVTPQAVVAEVQDEGPGFNPEAVPDPLAPDRVEQPGGRGVFLMRHYMSRVSYNPCGNCVTLLKLRGPARRA